MSKKTRRKNRKALAGYAARHADVNGDNVVLGPSFPVAVVWDGDIVMTDELGRTVAVQAKRLSKEGNEILGRWMHAKGVVRWVPDEPEGELEKDPDPPALATSLFLLIPIRQREHLLGDLEEEFRTKLVPRFGLRRARAYYYWQVIIELAAALTRVLAGAIVGFAISRFTK